jgi:malate/lactate dehydrogenase
MNTNLIITIIGFGEVGSTVASLINTHYEGLFFNVVDPSDEIAGRILDFSNVCAVKKNEAFINDDEMTNRSDFVIYCAGFCNEIGVSRNQVAHKNYLLVNDLFSKITLKPTASVLVVTNPVELVSRWIYEALNKSNLVLGTGTSLDSYRMNDYIADSEDLSLLEINALLLGEHGEFLVPIYSSSYIKEINGFQEFSEDQKHHFLEEVKQTANQIRKTEKATKFGVSECVISILRAFIENKKLNIPLSVLINKHYKNLLGVEDDIFISLPCEFSSGKVCINNLKNLTELEIEALSQAAKHLALIYKPKFDY